ncbi:hypothetical protein B0H21DRAFT_823022 [Amylocystis lapponica]|nr:hypothetical protein B0H21DRAFT_823022 [Amylocystis lapponica]
MSTVTTPKLFQPIKVGAVELSHRVVLAPLTRRRADAQHVHSDIGVEYYSQRASEPGSLLITEGTFIFAKAGGISHVPGLWSDAQLAAWRKITDAVHAKGSFIFAQLWALGRAAYVDQLEAEDPSFPYVSASDVKISTQTRLPRPLTVAEIKEYVDGYAKAASDAVHRAGFDGVEIHGANGYLVDQFLQDVTNTRTDEYGGSIEKRSRFGLEVVDAVTKAVGADRTAIRLSPWGPVNDMRMDDPIPTFSHFVTRLAELHPDLAYLHVVDPRVTGYEDHAVSEQDSNDFIRKIWAPRPLISAGGFTREKALTSAEETGDLIAFGRHYIANPDLPLKLRNNLPLTKYNRDTFYIPGPQSVEGYTDYPFAAAA